MTDHDAIWDYRDGQQAQRLAEFFNLEGWLVEWVRVESVEVEVEWEARLSGPSLPGRVVGRGRSRVSAISKAHVLAIRRLKLGDVPVNPTPGPDHGAGIVPVVPVSAEPVLSP